MAQAAERPARAPQGAPTRAPGAAPNAAPANLPVPVARHSQIARNQVARRSRMARNQVARRSRRVRNQVGARSQVRSRFHRGRAGAQQVGPVELPSQVRSHCPPHPGAAAPNEPADRRVVAGPPIALAVHRAVGARQAALAGGRRLEAAQRSYPRRPPKRWPERRPPRLALAVRAPALLPAPRMRSAPRPLAYFAAAAEHR